MIILGGIALSVVGLLIYHSLQAKMWTCCSQAMTVINDDKHYRYCKKCGFHYRNVPSIFDWY
jgi:hypothetical protein